MPITAIVAENGVVALFMRGGELQIEYAQDEATRTHNAQRLAVAARRVLREVPGSTLGARQRGRITTSPSITKQSSRGSTRQPSLAWSR